MKIIGLTGSVGSGKTTVAHILEKEFGAKVLIADEIGHFFMQPNREGYQKILMEFGEDILEDTKDKENRKIDRKKLAEKVFKDISQLEALNHIIHPLVKEYLANMIARERKKGECSYLFIESALLIEAGYEKICDELWYVTAKEEIRRKRLKASRNYSDEKITSILKNQLSDEIFRKKCKKVLENNGDIAEILQQIKFLLEI